MIATGLTPIFATGPFFQKPGVRRVSLAYLPPEQCYFQAVPPGNPFVANPVGIRYAA
jgi:hypothetical protein